MSCQEHLWSPFYFYFYNFLRYPFVIYFKYIAWFWDPFFNNWVCFKMFSCCKYCVNTMKWEIILKMKCISKIFVKNLFVFINYSSIKESYCCIWFLKNKIKNYQLEIKNFNITSGNRLYAVKKSLSSIKSIAWCISFFIASAFIMCIKLALNKFT